MDTIRLLVVDDEDVVLRAVRKALRKDNLDIETVHSGAEALEQLSEHAFDLVIADLMMPGMNGIELLKRIKELELAVPTIMLTGYPTVRTAIQAKRLGASDYVIKPFTRRELRSALIRTIKSARFQTASESCRAAVSGLPVYYIPNHSWVHMEQAQTVRIGMAVNFAASIGDIHRISLPQEDDLLEQGRVCAEVTDADNIVHLLYSPVSGRVVATNDAVTEEPALCKQDPEGAGWLTRVEARDLDRELADLEPPV